MNAMTQDERNRKVHDELVREFSALSLEDRIKRLIASGILTKALARGEQSQLIDQVVESAAERARVQELLQRLRTSLQLDELFRLLASAGYV